MNYKKYSEIVIERIKQSKKKITKTVIMDYVCDVMNDYGLFCEDNFEQTQKVLFSIVSKQLPLEA